MLQQCADLVTVTRIDGNSRARTYAQRLTAYGKRLADTFGDFYRHGRGIIGIANRFENNGKLIPPDPGYGIDFPDRRHEALSNYPQKPIAGLVTVLVVDRLEIVQIHEQERQGLVVTLGPCDS
jgi:hypothetical protein